MTVFKRLAILLEAISALPTFTDPTLPIALDPIKEALLSIDNFIRDKVKQGYLNYVGNLDEIKNIATDVAKEGGIPDGQLALSRMKQYIDTGKIGKIAEEVINKSIREGTGVFEIIKDDEFLKNDVLVGLKKKIVHLISAHVCNRIVANMIIDARFEGISEGLIRLLYEVIREKISSTEEQIGFHLQYLAHFIERKVHAPTDRKIRPERRIESPSSVY